MRRESPLSIILRWQLPIVVLMVGCGGEVGPAQNLNAQPRERLSVAAAANLKFAFDEIVTAFEKRQPNVDVAVTYGSSGNFFAQLSQRAPYDIFFSADTKYPRELVAAGIAAEESFFLYATGRIVVWVPHGSPIDLDALGIKGVVDPSVKKIAIANPRLAPYGVAAEEALQALGVYEAARGRLVFGENITQTAHFVESGAADVGILALSLALSPELKQNGTHWVIPSDAHRPIDQAAVIPIHGTNPEAANRLREFIIGPEGGSILARFGYSPSEEPAWTGPRSGSH